MIPIFVAGVVLLCAALLLTQKGKVMAKKDTKEVQQAAASSSDEAKYLYTIAPGDLLGNARVGEAHKAFELDTNKWAIEIDGKHALIIEREIVIGVSMTPGQLVPRGI